jgi:hypothetical protein
MDCLVLSGLNVACGFTPGRVLPSGLSCRRAALRSVAAAVDAVADSGDFPCVYARRAGRLHVADARPKHAKP